jgi:hypothetical protein
LVFDGCPLAGLMLSPAYGQTSIVISQGGEVTTTSRHDNGVLGVVNQIVRPKSHVRERVGACFYVSKTAIRNWVCRQSACSLDCGGHEPVGGC